MLVQAGADTSLRNTSGEQPLHVAAEGGLTDAVDLLLEGGAAVAAPIRSESGGSTPLHLAAENGHAEVVARLIAAKAPVDQQDRSGRTALYIAVDEEHEEVVSLLLRAGANPNVEARYNRNEDTPVTLAAHDGPGELLAMLLEGGGDPNRPGGGSSVRPLGLAAAEGSVEKVRLLLRAGAIVSTESRSRSPLHAAAATSNAAGAEAVIAVLIDAGHRVDVTDAGGATPLHEAAEAGNAGAIGVLLSRGAPVNAPDECGATPLWLAVATSRYNEERAFGLAQILVKAGADVNVTNTCTKETLLAAVERNGLARVRQLLVARGARQP
jgi:cytohesin